MSAVASSPMNARRPAVRSRDRTWRRRPVQEAALVVLGAAIAAYAFNALLRPNGLTPGGLPGLSVVILRATGIEPAVSQAVLNVFFVAASAWGLGRRFAAQSLVGCLALPFFVWATRDVPVLTHDHLLAALCGAVGIGLGVGLVFRGHGSVGGFTSVAMIVNRHWGWPVDRTLWLLDGCVALAAIAYFPAENVLASLVSIFLIGRTARAVLTGFDTATVAWVVTNETGRVRDIFLHELDLGVTVIPARGGYTDAEREILMVVMRPGDVPLVKARIRAVDPTAFLVLASSSEVLGHGFKPHL